MQWQRAASGSPTFANIAGATAQDYAIAFTDPADNGVRFRAVLSCILTINNVKDKSQKPIAPNTKIQFTVFHIIGWTPITAAKIILGARTGLEFERHWMDDVAVVYNTDIAPRDPVLSFSRTATAITITWTSGGTLEKAPAVIGPWSTTGDSDGSYTEAIGTVNTFFRVKR